MPFFTKVSFTGYLIGVDALITPDAVGDDYKFLLRIRGRDKFATGSTILSSTDNSKWKTFNDFKNYLYTANRRNFGAWISHDIYASNQPKFTEAIFKFKFMKS